MRNIRIVTGEHYHVFNRGVDKRDIFVDADDLNRLFQSMLEFNTVEPIGSIYENSFRKKTLGNSVSKREERLVDFIAYCLNQNHYHFILRQIRDNGVEKFMHRLGLGYTKFFNNKHDRTGVLFQGKYKAVHVDSNEYLLHLSVYVNLNNRVHRSGNRITRSSWNEYVRDTAGICKKEIILDQFPNIGAFQKFTEGSLEGIRGRKEMEKLLLE